MNRPAGVPSFSRPAFVDQARAEFDALIAINPDIVFVDAVVVDINGVVRGKRVPIAAIDTLFATGMQIPRTVFLMDPLGEMTSPFGRGFADGDPDGTGWPIPGTLSLQWGAGPKRAQLLTTVRNELGAPEAAEPRAALERVLERFAELELTPAVALELEFYLIASERDASGAPQPPQSRQGAARDAARAVYEVEDLDRHENFLSCLREAAALQHVPLGAASSEYGPGQIEVNLQHQDLALRAADHAVLLKQIVKTAAQAQGLNATFMAKPYPQHTGSGMHVHVSLHDRSCRNVFDDGSVEGSETLHHAIGGLRALMPESMALFAPSVNSYRRFQADMFAPVNRSWAVNNRSVGLRIPVSPGTARRVEHRAAGADANPYYLLAAVLAGVHHGITHRLDPGQAAAGNASREPDLALPFTLEDALSRLGEARVLADYIGEDALALYRESKRLELMRFRSIVPRAEYDWYL